VQNLYGDAPAAPRGRVLRPRGSVARWLGGSVAQTGATAANPPSIDCTVPVIQREASDARKVA